MCPACATPPVGESPGVARCDPGLRVARLLDCARLRALRAGRVATLQGPAERDQVRLQGTRPRSPHDDARNITAGSRRYLTVAGLHQIDQDRRGCQLLNARCALRRTFYVRLGRAAQRVVVAARASASRAERESARCGRRGAHDMVRLRAAAIPRATPPSSARSPSCSRTARSLHHVRRMRRIYASRRDALVEAASSPWRHARFPRAEGGMAVWAKATDGIDVKAWAAAASARASSFREARDFDFFTGRSRSCGSASPTSTSPSSRKACAGWLAHCLGFGLPNVRFRDATSTQSQYFQAPRSGTGFARLRGMDGLVREIRYAIRTLSRSPGFTGTAARGRRGSRPRKDARGSPCPENRCGRA
jgi:hypothetical protein